MDIETNLSEIDVNAQKWSTKKRFAYDYTKYGLTVLDIKTEDTSRNLKEIITYRDAIDQGKSNTYTRIYI